MLLLAIPLLSTLNTLPLVFSLNNECNCGITDVFKKTDKLPVLLNYTPMIRQTKRQIQPCLLSGKVYTETWIRKCTCYFFYLSDAIYHTTWVLVQYFRLRRKVLNLVTGRFDRIKLQ